MPPEDPKKHVERTARRRQAARAVEPPGATMDPSRRESCRLDLVAFCRTYFGGRFYLPFGADHLLAIQGITTATIQGGCFAMAMPRGSGKTTLCEAACLWALLYGHKKSVYVVAATSTLTKGIIDSLKSELENNELLHQDFPEACNAIVALNGIARKAEGQAYSDGRLTNLVWKKDIVKLPSTAAGGGSVITGAGLGGAIRGAKIALANGEQARPDLVLIDDPQTDQSARSSVQTGLRMSKIRGAVMGLHGPDVPLSIFAAVTVIQKGDLAEQLLDRKKNPEWHGRRFKMLNTMPTNVVLWDKYYTIIREDAAEEFGKTRAIEFYKENREAMDEGGKAAWEERKLPEDISAIQHAMDIRMAVGDPAFHAEFQNDPLSDNEGDAEALIADQVVRRTNGMNRTDLPTWAECVTAFIDVQQKGLWYVVCAWGQDFRGQVIDYGTFPDQQLAYFTNRDMRNTLAQAFPGATTEAQIASGLHDLMEILTNRKYSKPDGNTLPLERCLIDANWQESTPAVYGFCKSSEWKGILLPSHGRYIGAATKDMDAWRKEQGEKAGPGWRITPSKHGSRMALYDTNRWKTLICARFKAKDGAAGITLWGEKPERHRCFADHCAAEYRVRTTGRGRELDEWKLRPGRDNHWWDGLVGAAVAASIQGIQIKAGAPVDPARKPALAPRQGQTSGHNQGRSVMSLAEMRERAKSRRGA